MDELAMEYNIGGVLGKDSLKGRCYSFDAFSGRNISSPFCESIVYAIFYEIEFLMQSSKIFTHHLVKYYNYTPCS